MLKNTCTKMERIGRALNTDVEVGIREVGTLHWEGGRYEGEREGEERPAFGASLSFFPFFLGAPSSEEA
jgi:hypothetical protein